MTDEQILALNEGEVYFSETPSRFPEAGHGTQYHCGAPGLLKFARALLAAASAQSSRQAVAWECSSPAGEKPSLAFLTSKKPTVEHYENQGWRVLPLYTQATDSEQVRRDAERYRWLRERFVTIDMAYPKQNYRLTALDEFIDAALSQQPAQEE